MSYTPPNPNGQTTSANSAPVVIASDQSTVKVKLANDIANTTGNITTATTVVTTGLLSGVGSVTVQVSGTHAGINVSFEGSIDNTIWVGLPAQPLASTTPVTTLTSGVLGTNSTTVWNISPILGVNYVRVRATAWTSGSGAVVISPSAQFGQYLVNVGTMPTVATTLGSTTLTAVVPGVAATSLGKAEDAAHVSGDTGLFALGVRNDNAATSATSANGDYSQISVDTNGTVFTKSAPSTSPTLTSVAGSATSVSLLASNPARRGATIWNDSASVLYLKLGTTASITSASVKLVTDAYYEVPFAYTGAIDGIWVSATGNARITEIA